jgi:thioredoxin 1
VDEQPYRIQNIGNEISKMKIDFDNLQQQTAEKKDTLLSLEERLHKEKLTQANNATQKEMLSEKIKMIDQQINTITNKIKEVDTFLIGAKYEKNRLERKEKREADSKINFAEQVATKVKSNPGVVLYFTAEWCGPCNKQKPEIEKIKNMHPNVTFITIDIDIYEKLADEYNIKTVPTMVYFKQGVLVKKNVAAPLETIKSNLNAFYKTK